MASKVISKLKVGRPSREVALQNKSERILLEEFNNNLEIIPDILEQLRKKALNPSERQQLASIKMILEMNQKFLEKLQADEVKDNETKVESKKEDDNQDLEDITPQIQWDYQEDSPQIQ